VKGRRVPPIRRRTGAFGGDRTFDKPPGDGDEPVRVTAALGKGGGRSCYRVRGGEGVTRAIFLFLFFCRWRARRSSMGGDAGGRAGRESWWPEPGREMSASGRGRDSRGGSFDLPGHGGPRTYRFPTVFHGWSCLAGLRFGHGSRHSSGARLRGVAPPAGAWRPVGRHTGRPGGWGMVTCCSTFPGDGGVPRGLPRGRALGVFCYGARRAGRHALPRAHHDRHQAREENSPAGPTHLSGSPRACFFFGIRAGSAATWGKARSGEVLPGPGKACFPVEEGGGVRARGWAGCQ